ncbi:MAG: 3-dehydroquinate synthase [Acidobacteria bacterium]|nr:3-dehydroquinate synthase [Acidobacteriota bacterium]
MASIQIKTPSAEYTVTLGSGLLRTLRQRIQRALGGGTLPRVFFITSQEIWAKWSDRATESFDGATVLFVPPGERFKRLPTVERLLEELARAGADRDSVIIAFGGGVIGDMAGFIAAIYMRGIRCVQVPTTLLAQVDSSVGGKTGANLAAGKNLVGSFHHPIAVISDVDVLSTLPKQELRAGLQESVKSGIIRDARLFAYLEKNAKAVLRGDTKALAYVVERSVRVKADVVNQDERESGLRMILNFGHTIGHAIEAATNYKQLLHGEAIGWGMIAAVRLAQARGAIAEKDAQRIVKLAHVYGPLPRFTATAEKLVRLSASDKKNRGGARRFILPTGIGTVEIVKDVTEEELLAACEQMLGEVKRARR